MERLRRALVAIAAGLALADASIVALALPPILVGMHTTITGVAAIVGVYALVLAIAIWPVSRLRTGPWGFVLFGAASLGCGLAGSLGVLLGLRAVQAVGGAAALLAAYTALDAAGSRDGRRLWLGAALVGTAAGPALGGVLTEVFDWRAIFVVQTPLAFAAAWAAWRPAPAARGATAARDVATPPRDDAAPPATLWSRDAAAAAPLDGAGAAPAPAPPRGTPAPDDDASPAWLGALAFTAAAFTAVLFLLVIELVAGFGHSPIAAALCVTVLPLAAVAATAVPGDPRPRALAGALLIAGGAAALAFLPGAGLGWTIVPQVLAGAGMGLALPAFADAHDLRAAAGNLTVRHAGIVIVLAILAPVATAQLASRTEHAILQGTSLVLDAQIDPLQKLQLAPALLDGVGVEAPRASLKAAVEHRRADFATDAEVYDRLGHRLDDVVVVAVLDAFRSAYLIAAALALVGAALLAPALRRPAVIAAAGLAVAMFAVYVAEHRSRAPAPVVLQDPCRPPPLPDAGGLSGAIQNEALRLLDRGACQAGTSREELALALFNRERAAKFQREHGINPHDLGGLLSLLGG